MIEVAAAVIHRDGKFLICQRPKGKALELLWEFPGGKIESNETAEQCLIRECQEELGVTINVIRCFDDIVFTYPNFIVHITFFDAEIAYGDIVNIEHNRLEWISNQDVGLFEFCPADVEMLKRNTLSFRDY